MKTKPRLRNSAIVIFSHFVRGEMMSNLKANGFSKTRKKKAEDDDGQNDVSVDADADRVVEYADARVDDCCVDVDGCVDVLMY